MKFLYKPILLIGLLSISLLGSGCFEVLEEIFLRANGSGTFESNWSYKDLAQFMDAMAEEIEDAKKENGETAASTYEGFSNPNIWENFETLIDQTKQIPGISEVLILHDKDVKILSYSFSFDNIDALNIAMARNSASFAQLAHLGAGAEENAQPRFTFDGKKLTTSANKKLDQETLDNKEILDMMMPLYQGNSYYIKYNFEQKVKKVKQNQAAIKGANIKTVLLEVPMEALLKGDVKLDNQIVLKK